MLFAKVVGNVVCTRKEEKLNGKKLLIVQPVDIDNKPKGNALVAVDAVGAGAGEMVLLVQGSSARQTEATNNTPVDCTVFAILDTADKDGKTIFKKSKSSDFEA